MPIKALMINANGAPPISANDPDIKMPIGNPYTAKCRTPSTDPRNPWSDSVKIKMVSITITTDCEYPATANNGKDVLNQIDCETVSMTRYHIHVPIINTFPGR